MNMKLKKFKYKLQSILEIKKKKEEEEKEKLAKLFRKLAEEEQKLDDLKSQESLTREELRKAQIKGNVDLNKVKMHHAYLKKLENLIINQQIYIKEVEAEIERQRNALIKATQEKKTYEKLKEKHLERFIEEAEKEERKFIDELATMRHHRLMRAETDEKE